MKTKENRLTYLLDEAPVIVWLTDAAGSCTFLNRRWYEFTGQTPETALGTGWLQSVHQDDREFSYQAFRAASDNREPFQLDYRVLGKNGNFRWAIDSGRPRFGPDGEFLGFVGTVVDIHDRRITEEKLRASEERYRHLFESIDEGFCVIEMIFDEQDRAVDYRWLEVNPVFEKQTGLVDAVGKTARQLVPDLDESWFQTYGRVALTGEPIRFENNAPAMNRWFDVFAFRVDRPEQRRVALLFNEVSERKTRELDAAFLADLGAEFARARDPREILTTAGTKLCRHLRLASAAFVEIDDASGVATVFHEERRGDLPSLLGVHRLTDFMTDGMLDELRAGQTVAISDVASDPRTESMAPAYEKLGVRSHIQGSFLSGGRWKFMLSVHDAEPRQWREREVELMRELSALVWLRLERARGEERMRQNEQSLRELSRSLEQRVAERTAELEEQTARLRHMAAELASTEQRERKRFAALLHDDLQQLLVASSMHLNNLSRQIQGVTQREAVEQAARWIGEATSAARHLTHQLRPPALYEDGLVAALYGLASEMAKRHQLKVAVHGGEAATPLSDDIKALLFESIRELLFNIAKHAGVEEASVRVWEEGGSLHVAVEDSGAGFDSEAAGRNRSKAGFGLFSIRERLASLGGQMSVASTPGEGTRITLEMPLLPGVTEEQPKRPPRPPAAGRVREKPDAMEGAEGRLRILVVDDHAMVRQGLATLLNEDDRLLVVAEAADGIAAIDAVEVHRPDVMLIDLNMPRMNGIEAAREINRRWPRTIIIGLSVQDDEATANAMRAAGAAAFLSKAGDSDRMISTILDLAKQAVEAKTEGSQV